MKVICYICEKNEKELFNIKALSELTKKEKTEIANKLNIQGCAAANYIIKAGTAIPAQRKTNLLKCSTLWSKKQ